MTCRPRSFGVALLLLICSLSPAHATWNKIYQFNFTHGGRVSACYFFNADTGLIAFNCENQEFKVLRTTDGGVTWTNVVRPAIGGGGGDVWFNEFWFKNALEGWAAFKSNGSGAGGGVWHTTDGGLTWAQTNMGNETMSVRKTGRALVVSSNTWGINFCKNNDSIFDIQQPGKRNCLAFANDTDGVCTGYFGSGFLITKDGGMNWGGAQTRILNECWGIYNLKGSGSYVAADEDGHNHGVQSPVYRSNDYGKTWRAITMLGIQIMGDIEGEDSTVFVQNTGYILGTQPGLYRSTDLGQNWTAIGGPNQSFDARIGLAYHTCGQVIYAFDSTGGVWKTVDGGDGFIPTGGGNLTVTPSSLFDKDTIFCGDTLTKTLTIEGTGCNSPLVQRFSFNGTDAANYVLESDSTVRIKFIPRHAGPSVATLDISVSDGSTITIPLAGVRDDLFPPLHILTANVKTDTIGGEVQIPITIAGLHKPQDVTFVMHYAGDVDYLGTTSAAGTALDIAGEQWQGRTKLETFAHPDTVVAYAHFRVYTDSSFLPHAIFDSIQLIAAPDCPYVFATPDTSTIGIPLLCGDDILSHFMRTGSVTVSIRPNPTTAGVFISAQQELGATRVLVRNSVGAVLDDRTLTIGAIPAQLLLPAMEGFYDIELQENGGNLHFQVIRQR